MVAVVAVVVVAVVVGSSDEVNVGCTILDLDSLRSCGGWDGGDRHGRVRVLDKAQ